MPHNAQLIDVDLAVCSTSELELHDFHGSMVNSISPLPHSCSSPSPSNPLTLQHSSTLMSLLFCSRNSITLCISLLGNYFSFTARVCMCQYTTYFSILSAWLHVVFLCSCVGLCVSVPVWTHMKKQQLSRKTESEFPCQLGLQGCVRYQSLWESDLFLSTRLLAEGFVWCTYDFRALFSPV